LTSKRVTKVIPAGMLKIFPGTLNIPWKMRNAF
jgi:hypothetical protein